MKRAVSVSRPHFRWQATLAYAICCGDKSTSTQDLVACLRAPYFLLLFFRAGTTTAFKTFSATAIITGLTKSLLGSRLLPNVGLTCKGIWRGPCASTARDKRPCQVEAPVIMERTEPDHRGPMPTPRSYYSKSYRILRTQSNATTPESTPARQTRPAERPPLRRKCRYSTPRTGPNDFAFKA